MAFRGYAIAVSAALLLAACSSGETGTVNKFFDAQFSKDVEAARKLPPPGDDWRKMREQPKDLGSFSKNLSRDYKALMIFEWDEMYDDISAVMYARRALASGRGEEVAPLKLADFKLPKPPLPSLRQARSDTLALFAKGSREKFPLMSAKLQSSFDCWVEQQEENHQPDDITACRDEFIETLRKLRKAMEPPPVVVKEPAPAPAPAPAPKFEDSYTVYFDLNKATLNDASRATIAEVIRALQAQNAGASIIGHTDTLGSAKYNLSLSERRAKAISEQVLKAGIRPAVVTTEGRGERDLAKPTADNVGEPKNRRAVINIR